ncbi:MAG TPA: hypothetical protein VFR75_00945, partial [Solirubrobacterales bacterium]|nr:hypothetical protein [Solirubrobacterales bacterium]
MFFCAVALVLALAAPVASADTPEFLGEFGEAGTGAGQFKTPRAMVASPTSGHLFVVDGYSGAGTQTNRIDEFTAWGQFVKSWGWGVRDGSPELQTCGPEATPPSAECLPGLEGDGAGQFDQPGGIAIDSAGSLYVYDARNYRVQKFSPDGEFLLMFGGGVNETTGGDVCPVAPGDICKAGAPGTGDGEFAGRGTGEGEFEFESNAWQGNFIGVGPGDVLFVAGPDRIQAFSSAGAFIRSIPLPDPGEPGYMAVDPASGDIYFAYAYNTSGFVSEQPDIYRLDPATGDVLDVLPLPIPEALATDADGNLFAATRRWDENNNFFHEVVMFDSSGDPVIPVGSKFAPSYLQANFIFALATNTVTEAGGIDLFVAFGSDIFKPKIEIYGPGPDKWPPPPNPPQISAQFADVVGSEDASLKAKINPLFWADTKYFLEYGTSPCALGGCVAAPAPPGLPLDSGVVNLSFTSSPIELTGLEPGTTYHYRFVASSSGGGPTIG